MRCRKRRSILFTMSELHVVWISRICALSYVCAKVDVVYFSNHRCAVTVLAKSDARRVMAIQTRIISSIKSNHDIVANKILIGLGERKFKEFTAKMHPVDLPIGQVLYQDEEIIDQCYFINSGLISIVSIKPNGKSVEVGLIGNE